jgi:ABC-type nitrate/sulfonate/bicarbonate transport system substrate-binding protein
MSMLNTKVLAAAVALTVAHAGSAAAQPAEVKVGISTNANTVLALWMAEAGGFYAAQGLKVSIVNSGGGSRGATDLQAGRLDVMHVGLSSVIKLNQAGGDLRTISSLANMIRFVFFAGPGVKGAADLKGGTVAISSPGSESDATVTLALQRLGLTRNDVVVKEYGDSLKRLTALKSGEVKATTLNEPFSSAAREQGLNPMVDLAAENIPWLFSTLVVKRSALSSNREVLSRFLKATIEGNYLALADPKRAQEVLAKETGIADPKILEISYRDFVAMTPLNTEPTRAGAETILAQFPAAVSRNFDDYIDLGILESLKKEGFFSALEQKYGKR